jgi:hypothetical protein
MLLLAAYILSSFARTLLPNGITDQTLWLKLSSFRSFVPGWCSRYKFSQCWFKIRWPTLYPLSVFHTLPTQFLSAKVSIVKYLASSAPFLWVGIEMLKYICRGWIYLFGLNFSRLTTCVAGYYTFICRFGWGKLEFGMLQIADDGKTDSALSCFQRGFYNAGGKDGAPGLILVLHL